MSRRVVLSVLLGATLAHAQAVAPLPEPVAEPVTTFETPGATPAGAGASHGGLAAPGVELAPRSPNKRELPVTNEPGIWAADEVGASSISKEHSIDIAGVWLKVPAGRKRAGPSECAQSMNKAINFTDNTPSVAALPPARQMCLALSLLAYCAGRRFEQASQFRGEGPEPADERYIQWADAVAAAAAMYDAQCKDVRLSDKDTKLLDTITLEWQRRIRPLRRSTP